MEGSPSNLEQLAHVSRGLVRDAFVALHPAPFLIRLEDTAGGDIRKTASAVAAAKFHTVTMSASRARAASRLSETLAIHELKKRPGSNAFLHMITLGRAANNDIVIGHDQVSKFHASFTRSATGAWTVTDASTNGTWLDTDRLALRVPSILRTGSTLNLANAVHLVLLSPEAMFDEIERLRKRSVPASGRLAG